MGGKEKTFSKLLFMGERAISTGLRPRITAWGIEKLMQSTHIYRASGVVGYEKEEIRSYDKGRAELPEPISPAAHSVPIRILLGSAVPKPCFLRKTLPFRAATIHEDR